MLIPSSFAVIDSSSATQDNAFVVFDIVSFEGIIYFLKNFLFILEYMKSLKTCSA